MMTEKETIEQLNSIIKCMNLNKSCNISLYKEDKGAFESAVNIIQNKQKEIEKKDKIIDLMAKEIDDCGECPHEIYEEDFDCENCENHSSIECWKQYFEKKAEDKQC